MAEGRNGVSFEVQELELQDDRLVVSGHWSGLRGLRFVRPTLVAGNRRIHATLEHKPWAPDERETWVAAFPWRRGDAVDPSALELAVAPSVVVSLGGSVDAGEPASGVSDGDEQQARAAAKPAVTKSTVAAPAVADAPRPVSAGAAAEPRDEPRTADGENDVREHVVHLDRHRTSRLEAEIAALEEECEVLRDELSRSRAAAARERERALEQRDEAMHDLAAALRTRDRMERRHDEALAAQERAEARLGETSVERDELRRQRDEILVAYRALERRLRREAASDDDPAATEPVAAEEQPPAAPAHTSRAPAAVPAKPGDAPLGVVKVPAARRMLAELQRPAPAQKFGVSKFDIWAIRVLGSVAAASFILLLLMIVRVFI